MDSTIAWSMNDNINMDRTIAGSMNDNINNNSSPQVDMSSQWGTLS